MGKEFSTQASVMLIMTFLKITCELMEHFAGVAVSC
jgi:hypothetical protein